MMARRPPPTIRTSSTKQRPASSLRLPPYIQRTLAKRREVELLPELALGIARSLRAGRPLPVALADADTDGHESLGHAVRQVSVGRSVPAVLCDWHERSSSDAEELLAAALVVGSTTCLLYTSPSPRDS